MNIVSAQVINFGSYERLDFTFDSLGLTLVSGATGAGKSTLQDIIPWILFGVTSKDGKVDDVRSWGTEEEATCGFLTLESLMGYTTVFRRRGSSSQNDLYWTNTDSDRLYRGKDITETQNLLEEYLGISAELYLTGACFNEFSTAGNFFTNTLQQKRQLFETLTNLDLAVKLTERTIDAKKQNKKLLQTTTAEYTTVCARLTQLGWSVRDSISRRDGWAMERATRLETLNSKAKSFEREEQEKIDLLEKKRISEENKKNESILSLTRDLIQTIQYLNLAGADKCIACNQPIPTVVNLNTKVYKLNTELEKLKSQVNPFIKDLLYAKQQENPYYPQILNTHYEINPFMSQIDSINCDIEKTENKQKELKDQIDILESETLDLTELYNMLFEFRGELLKRSIANIESTTNDYLERFFDGEIRISFNIAGADKLETTIEKNGHECSYSQLSRGQRSMLKLSFSVSVMKASANNAGIHFNCLFFDEVLDGLDSNLKVKALGLFEELELDHESIFITDHASEIQSQFNRRFEVTLEGDKSIVKEL
jgi:DNA repair exonuclease SbcCD ATPase subunit